ncbi:MAG: hypothetical protein QOJ32_174, partial [Frankiaceae bacterium]|nr:hypothetical protein [Frankiaceae bacterium]
GWIQQNGGQPDLARRLATRLAG